MNEMEYEEFESELGNVAVSLEPEFSGDQKARDIIKSADEHSDKSVDEALKFRDQKRGHDIR